MRGATRPYVRRVPIKFDGYSISVKKGGYRRNPSPKSPAIPDDKWRVRVQIGREPYRDLTAYFLDIALLRTVEQLSRDLFSLQYEPYAPVRQQILNILRLVNKSRKAAGLDPVSPKVLRYQRDIVRPFEPTKAMAEPERGRNLEDVPRPSLDGLPQTISHRGIVR